MVAAFILVTVYITDKYRHVIPRDNGVFVGFVV